MNLELDGKTVLLTGASKGIGYAAARLFAQEGAIVVLAARREDELYAARDELARETGATVEAVPADVTLQEDLDRLAAHMDDCFGRVDVLVNNAGTTRFIDFPDLEAVHDEDWDRILAVNLKGPFQMARAAREALAAGGGGVIVNTASIAGIVGAGSSIPYCASKAAVINLTLSLARTLGPEIRVNAVAPGFIEGDWLQQGLGEAYESVRSAKAAGAVLGKVATPDDIASGILAMIQATHTTGHILPLDGGDTLGPRIVSGLK